ncbi:MAG TPA: coenzyme F420-0:L-glutamate ligase [Candidatus Saccharimonadales bacterium]|nr:coenzyme F420-0:L-glutamate ligase [Candidatus Saccharimonadales bacterium]
MKVTAVKTDKITAGQSTIYEILNRFLPELHEGSVVVITSKIVGLCENRVAPIGSIDKEELIMQEADLYLPSKISQYGYHFTYTKNTLVSASGIDESNSGGDYYVLWPKDPQGSANEIWKYLKEKTGLQKLGVMITDSACMPARYGTLVLSIGHCGFLAVNNYIGKPDLFGRPFKVSRSSVAGGLAAAAGIEMGEGTEQTPIVILEDIPYVNFQDRPPTQAELDDYYLPALEDDLFSPFLNSIEWQEGGHGAKI